MPNMKNEKIIESPLQIYTEEYCGLFINEQLMIIIVVAKNRFAL
jgi:hypothetical protein